jgi:N-methylhydantoinase A
MMALCYPGQTFDMPVPLPAKGGAITAKTVADTVERFHRMHEELHTYASRDQQPILRGLRVKAVAVEEKPPLPKLSKKARGNPRVGARKAFFRGRYVATPVYDGRGSFPGRRSSGPAIVEEPFTTIVVYPNQRATVDQWGTTRSRWVGSRQPPPCELDSRARERFDADDLVARMRCDHGPLTLVAPNGLERPGYRIDEPEPVATSFRA